MKKISQPSRLQLLLLGAVSIYILLNPLRVSVHIPECADPFYVRVPRTLNTPHEPSKWPCYVSSLTDYSPPLSRPRSLWRTPKANVGDLNRSQAEYRLHVTEQRWARFEDAEINILHEGGTSGRAFSDNFAYVQHWLSFIRPLNRCGWNKSLVMLDTGAGIGSVAAALSDERGAAGKVKALSYVWPDNYLRLQTIISDRGFPAFLANFTGRLPFPSNSFDIVHCKWCWHHLAGYNVWLNEVNRLLVPGGYFVFTFTPEKGNILKRPQWDKALARQPFFCKKIHRIITMCQKRPLLNKKRKATNVDKFRVASYCPTRMKSSIDGSKAKLKENWPQIFEEREKIVDATSVVTRNSTGRLLNLNCPDEALCMKLDSAFEGNTLHINTWSQQHIVQKILSVGGLAMLHRWRYNIPVYPRSFDAVNVGCDSKSRYLLKRPTFWVELHRVLRPGGIVTVARSFCGWNRKRVTSLMSRYGFEVNDDTGGVLIGARREMYPNNS